MPKKSNVSVFVLMSDIASRCLMVLFWALLLKTSGFAFQLAQQIHDEATNTSSRVLAQPESEQKKNSPVIPSILTSPLARTKEEISFSAMSLMNAGVTQSGRRSQPGMPPQPDATARPLTLDQVLNQIEAYHPKLRGAQAEREVAAAKRLEKQGAFDPVVNFGTGVIRYNSTSKPGSALSTRTNDVELEYLTRSGVKLIAGSRFNYGTVKSPLSSTGETGEYYLGVKVPLMRNFRINEKSAAERQALLGEPLADEQVKLTRLDLQLKAALSYWDWVAAKQKLDVAKNLLELSKIRAAAVKDRVTAGDLPPIDTIEADQEVQRRQGGLTKAERDLQKAAFKLSLYLWETNGQPAPAPSASAVPTNLARPNLFADNDVIEAQRLAIERRPELKLITINQDISRVDLALGQNQRRPAVDLGFSPGRDTGFGGIGTTLKAELSISLPLRQRTADGKIQAAQAKLQKLDLDLLNQRQSIIIEVNDAFNAINTTYDRFVAAENEVQLARQLEVGERTRFNLGDSTLFLVNQRERATAEAETKLIEVRAEYEQAVAAFRAASGSLR